jgi:hypothetical protein
MKTSRQIMNLEISIAKRFPSLADKEIEACGEAYDAEDETGVRNYMSMIGANPALVAAALEDAKSYD